MGDAAARAAQPARRDRRPPPRTPCARCTSGRRPARGTARRRRLGARGAAAARRQPRRARADRARRRAAAATTSPQLALRLVDLAYSRVDMVTRRGEFAVRGGILDVFPPDRRAPRARRLLRRRGRAAARVLGRRPALAARATSSACSSPPSRELLLTEPCGSAPARCCTSSRASRGCSRRSPRASRSRAWSRSRPRCVDRLVPLTALPPGGRRGRRARRPSASRAARVSLAETNREFLEAAWSAATAGAEAPIDLASGDFLTVGELRDAVLFSAPGAPDPRTVVDLLDFDLGDADEVVPPSSARRGRGVRASEYVRVAANAVPSFAGQRRRRRRPRRPRACATAGASVVASRRSRPRRARTRRARRGAASPRASSTRCPPTSSPASPTSCRPTPSRGFEVPEAQARPAREAEFYGRTAGYDSRQVKKLASRRTNVVDPLQLKAGDYVVHQTHGIGRFVEMVQREVATGSRPSGRAAPPASRAPTAVREYLVLEYAPVEARPAGRQALRAHRPARPAQPLRRRRGARAVARWAAATGRRRRARRARPCATSPSSSSSSTPRAWRPRVTPSAPDTPWQRELEEAFPFAETPDQLQTIDEVKADMERPIPMDRLLSGDVGFGKTEVAVRAAFKAIQDGKQVAMLVPTTLLVQAAPRDVRRAVRRVPRAPARPQPVPDRQGGARDARRPRRRHGRRGDRHPPPAHRAGAASRTSGSSSSTRSSASASSTRTSSRS